MLSVFQLLIADSSVKHSLSGGSVTDVTISPCERRILLKVYLCLCTEKPDAKASGFLLSVFQLLIADLSVKRRCVYGSVTDVRKAHV